MSPGCAFPEKTRLAREMDARRRWMEERALVQSGVTSGNPELAESIMDIRNLSASTSLSSSLALSKLHQSSMSASNTALEEHLTCAICYGLFSHPVVLTCGHVFCEGCVQAIYEGQPEKYRLHCPLCRKRCDKLNRVYVLDSVTESVRLARSGLREHEGTINPHSEEGVELPKQLEVDILLKRISIATDAMEKCSRQVHGFNKLTQSYYSSIRKIDDKISQLKEQKELMTVEYKKTSANLERIIEKEKVLRGLIESLESELRVKQIMIAKLSPSNENEQQVLPEDRLKI